VVNARALVVNEGWTLDERLLASLVAPKRRGERSTGVTPRELSGLFFLEEEERFIDLVVGTRRRSRCGLCFKRV
jgi:hypothetical protein